MIGSYGVVLCCYLERFSFSISVSLSYLRPYFFRVRCFLLVARNVHRIVFLPIFVFCPFLPSFRDTYSLLTSSLGCNVLCMVISFLFHWPICLGSSLVHFKNGPENLTRSTARVFIPLVRFLLHNFVLGNFLVLLRYFF